MFNFNLRYIRDDKKITIKSIYKKNHRFSFPKFLMECESIPQEKNSAKLAFQEIENLPP